MDARQKTKLELVRYTAEKAEAWDAVVAQSRNGTFLLNRAYMDYHANRFHDCSFLVSRKNNVEAVIPGNIKDKVFYSHQGLTYGGVVSTDNLSAVEMLELFGLLCDSLRREGCSSMIYKPVPTIYHRLPAEEDLYALFRQGAKLVSRQISSAIIQDNKIPFIESRKSGIRKAVRSGVEIRESTDFKSFWSILEEVLLSRHETKPVHNREEIEMLHRRFSERIRLHVATLGGKVLAGVVMYVTERVAHVQYIASSEDGKRCGALDMIFDRLINFIYSSVPVFEFGVSTEQNGALLNEHLIFQKEGFGGRGIVYDTYEFAL